VMGDVSKWPRVWAKAPELEPSQRKDPLWWTKLEMVFGTEAANEMLCTLIRDKAVWWLAHKDVAPTVSSAATHYSEDGSPPVDTLWAIEGCFEDGNGQKEEREEVLSSDPTHALYLAVCKMLNIDPDTTT
jgi:hypothetical protein